MKQSIFFSILLLLASCSQDVNTISIQTNGKIVLIDSTSPTKNLLPYSEKDRQAFFPIYYLGEQTDTYKLGMNPIYAYSYKQKDYSDVKNVSWFDSIKMKIVVDTTFALSHRIDYWHYDNEKDTDITDSSIYYNAYPIFVYNYDDSLLFVGDFNFLGYCVRQAQNAEGKWIDIETPISFYCGTGARTLVIEPNQVLIAKLLRYKGDYKTNIRLKFERFQNSQWHRTVYSNTFIDYIDKRQLYITLFR